MFSLPAHLKSVEQWVDLANEVIVVDSASADGTLPFIQTHLKHRALRILSHPPGLYQSWNYGIGNCRSEYVYIATVGDSITRYGLEHLIEVAGNLRCDVVVSKPRFVDVTGAAQAAPEWPVDDMIQTTRSTVPFALDPIMVALFAFSHCTKAILGSSASNVYQTRILREHPFPSDFGTAGDGAWGIQNAPFIRLGVTPEVFSTFQLHPKSYPDSDYAVPDLNGKLLQLAHQTWREAVANNPSLKEGARELQFESILAAVARWLTCQRQLESCRRSRWPWSLNPIAWRARWRRGQEENRIAELKTAAAAHFLKGNQS